MKKFKFEDYKNAYVMHCKTEEEAKKFCKVMYEDGRRWITGKAYMSGNNYWDEAKEQTCYNFNAGRYGNISVYKGYIILNFSDFDWSEDKMFTKADLKTGDFVVETYGVEIVNKEYNVLICRNGGFNILSELDINDIEKVYRPKNEMTCCFNNYNKGTLIYDRSEQPVEMTIEEISKALGKKVKVVG